MKIEEHMEKLHPAVKSRMEEFRQSWTDPKLKEWCKEVLGELRSRDPFVFSGSYFVDDKVALTIYGYRFFQQLVLAIHFNGWSYEEIGTSESEMEQWQQICIKIDRDMKAFNHTPYLRGTREEMGVVEER